jgi:hypothetical protein
VTDETTSRQVSQTLNLRVQAAPPEEREILERKPVVREEPPDPTLPAPRDPLQMQVRDATGRANGRGPGQTPAAPRVPAPRTPEDLGDEMPEVESPGKKSAGEASPGGKSAEPSPEETAEDTPGESTAESPEEPTEESLEEPAESDDAETAAEETDPPLPPIE